MFFDEKRDLVYGEGKKCEQCDIIDHEDCIEHCIICGKFICWECEREGFCLECYNKLTLESQRKIDLMVMFRKKLACLTTLLLIFPLFPLIYTMENNLSIWSYIVYLIIHFLALIILEFILFKIYKKKYYINRVKIFYQDSSKDSSD